MLAPGALLALTSLLDRSHGQESNVEGPCQRQCPQKGGRLKRLDERKQAEERTGQFHHIILVIHQRYADSAKSEHYDALCKQ